MASNKAAVAAAAVALNAASTMGGGTSRVAYEDLHKTVNVTESNGEISCSVEDTNKLRALLGLKPLRLVREQGAVKTAEEIAVENFAAKKAADDKERELAEIQVCARSPVDHRRRSDAGRRAACMRPLALALAHAPALICARLAGPHRCGWSAPGRSAC